MKGQTAFECLEAFGWALLIVGVALLALSQLNKDNEPPETNNVENCGALMVHNNDRFIQIFTGDEGRCASIRGRCELLGCEYYYYNNIYGCDCNVE